MSQEKNSLEIALCGLLLVRVSLIIGVYCSLACSSCAIGERCMYSEMVPESHKLP